MKHKSKKAFTLIELLVVISIIAILAAVIAPNAFRAIEKSKVVRTVSDLKAIKSAALAYYADTGVFPQNDDNYNTNTGGLRGLDFIQNYSNKPGWNGPYLEKWPQATYWGNSHGGTYQWQGIYTYNGTELDFDGDTKADPCIELNFGDSGFSDAKIQGILQTVDNILDDGTLTTGMFVYKKTGWPQHTAYYCVGTNTQ